MGRENRVDDEMDWVGVFLAAVVVLCLAAILGAATVRFVVWMF